MLAIAASAGAAGEKAPAKTGPAEVVDSLQAALLDSMQKGKAVSCEARIGKLTPVILSSFDLPAVARLALRRHWSELSGDQQQQFVSAFADLVITTYASQFNDYGGETFGAPSAQDAPGGRKQVHTVLNRAGGEPPVSFDYVLQPSGKSWRVVNVLADGVSDLALRSAQYDSVIKSQGFDKLVAGLQQQASKNREGC